MANILSTSSLTTNTPTIPLNKENKIKLRDTTKGIGTVILLKANDGTLAYRPCVNKKKLVFPTYQTPDSGIGLVFKDSLGIRFEKRDNFIKIIELNKNEQLVNYYVDHTKPVQKAHDVYTYLPKEISEDEAKEKVKDIKTDFPQFRSDLTLYNRHGVAVFGWDETAQKYALCWANPYEEKVRMIECSQCERKRDGGSSFAKSKDEQLYFGYEYNGKLCLNSEPATQLIQ